MEFLLFNSIIDISKSFSSSKSNVGPTSSNLVLAGGIDILRCQMLKETYYAFVAFPPLSLSVLHEFMCM